MAMSNSYVELLKGNSCGKSELYPASYADPVIIIILCASMNMFLSIRLVFTCMSVTFVFAFHHRQIVASSEGQVACKSKALVMNKPCDEEFLAANWALLCENYIG